MDKIAEMWKEFGNIPVDSNENIDEPFHNWPRGTDKYEIWHWFDENSSKGLHYLMFGTL